MLKQVLSIAVLSALAVSAQAATIGYSSNTANVVTGAATGSVLDPNGNGHEAPAGVPGMSIRAASFPYNMSLAFSALQGLAPADANNVHAVDVSKMPPSHAALGNFNFAKVDTAAANVYFGEWSNAAGDTASHTVYYAGDNKTTNMPTTGVAIYNLKGVNNYDGNNLMAGKFVANFGTNTYSGNVRNSDYRVTMSGAIDTANAAFSGTAKAGSVVGVSQGNFFGANAAAVAGVATFKDRPDLDTAFGGAKR